LCVSRLNNACSLVNCFVWGFFYCSASVTDCTAKPYLLFGQCHRLYSKTFFTVLPVSQTVQQNLLYCSASVTDCTANLLYSSASVTDCTANIFTILPVSQTVQQTFFTVLPVSQTVQQTFLLFCQCHRLYSEPFFIQGPF